MGGWRDEDPRGSKTKKTGRGRSESLLDALVAELSMMCQRCGRARVTTSLSETERIRRGVARTVVRRNGGRVMWSNEGAAPLHAWRWKRKPASKEDNNSSVEEEGI